jgi:glycosyltransferase involved in cell wall biosynthesis
LARYDQWRAKRWEQHALSQAAAVVAVTESDAKSLSAISQRPTHVVSNGVDTRGFAQVQPDPHAQTILFVGNYEYAPNLDAVEWAAADILPLVWLQNPQARFIVCGHALPDHWRQRFPDPRIEWRGYVDHLPTVQSQASVFLAPLRFGGGSKLKVLEALAASLPVVSTREGLSGLGAQDGVHALVASTAPQMAQALVDLLGDPARAARLGQAARQLVHERFDWDAAAAQLEAVYQTLQPSGHTTVPA